MPKRQFRKAAVTTLAFVAAIAVSQMSLAEGDHDHNAHEGIYKDRADTMKSLGGAATTTGAMLKGKTPFDLEKARAAGQLVADKASTIPALFPEGTNAGESEALPIIWKDWEGFTAAAKLLGERAGVLATAEDQAAVGAAFGGMIKACGGCHKTYRLDKD